eukprot:gene9463-1669_t
MDPSTIICEGWLKKEEGTIMKRWSPKYYQLKGNFLFQFPDSPSKLKISAAEWKFDLSEKKNINIEIVDREEVSKSKSTSQEYFFKIQTKSSSHFFSCDTHVSCTEWVVSLKNIITKKDLSPWKRVLNVAFIYEKTEKEADMEKLLKLIQTKSTDDNMIQGASYLFKWYQKISKKIQKNQADYQEYMYTLHERIKQVESMGIEFSETQGNKDDRTCHLFLEFLNVYQKKKLQKLEAKEAFIRFQFIKICKSRLKLPKLNQFKSQLKDAFLRDIKEIDKEVEELQKQIEAISIELRERFIKYTEKTLEKEREKKEKVKKNQLDLAQKLLNFYPAEKDVEEIVFVENENEKYLVEIQIQIYTKEISNYSLKIDLLETYLIKNDIEYRFLYLRDQEMSEFWTHMFSENQMIQGIETLIKHLKVEQISLTHHNIKSYLFFLENSCDECDKNIEDFENVSIGLLKELEGLKTNSFNIQYHYILFAQTKLRLTRKQSQLERAKLVLFTKRKEEIQELETIFQKLVVNSSSDFDQEIPECDFILNDYKALHASYYESNFEKNEELIAYEKRVEEIKLELTNVKTIMSSGSITKKNPKTRHSSLYEILLDEQTFERKYLNNFIACCKSKEEREDFYYLKNAKLFIVDLTEIIEENRTYLNLENNEIYAAIEKILFGFVYEEFFIIFKDSDNDQKFEKNAQTITSTLISDLLPSLDPIQFKKDYGDGIEILNQLSEHRTPSSKLISIYCACKRILEILESQTENSTICGDDFLPVLICTLSCSCIKNIFTQIAFIKHLASDESLVSEEGYYFSSMESAAHFIADYEENKKNE